MDAILNNLAGLAALVVAVSGFAGLWWQRNIDQRKQELERIAAAKAAAEREEASETERIRLFNQIENERLASFKVDLADLRAQLKVERDERTALQQQYRQLLMFGRPEDQQRIAELEKEVARQAEEIRTLKGGK